MSLTAVAVLRSLALEAGVNTWEQDYYVRSVGIFSLHCRVIRQGRKVECAASDSLLLVRTKISSSISFAIGATDPILTSTSPIGSLGALPVFVKESANDETRLWLDAHSLASLDISTDERLFVWANVAEMYVLPADTSTIWARLDVLCRLLSELPPDRSARHRTTRADVPAELWRLLPLLSRWAVSDDADRSERISRARTPSLIALREAVVPLFGAINSYFDSFGMTTPEAANRLGDLAQAAMEAGYELERRAL